MRRILACVLTVMMSACISIVPPPSVESARAAEEMAVRQAMYSVVKISVEAKDGSGVLTGSGWANSEDTILTAGHVCEAIVVFQAVGLLKDDIQISYLNQTNSLDTKRGAEIIDMDGIHDICLLYLEDHGLPVLEFVVGVSFGDRAIVIGFPLGVMISALTGEVMVVDTGYGIMPLALRNKMFVNAPSTNGSSGGPVVGSDGRVIGMLVAGPSNGYDHLSICVPVKRLIRFMQLI